MKRYVLPILILSVLLTSCEKINIPIGYPTTYKKLSGADLLQKQTSFRSRNQFLKTTLNDFGFCDIDDDLLSGQTPPYNGDITESQAIAVVNDFVSRNLVETGINDPQDLSFRSKSKDISFAGSVLWHFRSVNQKIDTIEVLFSEILIHLENAQVSLCYGNWYPEINVPNVFNFNQSKAKTVLIGKVVSHYSIGGEEYKFTISKTNLDKSQFHLKIVPRESDDKIELHICWQIYIPDVSYKLYVDVMSGEIVRQEPTIIS
jgi:hypothetical protein